VWPQVITRHPNLTVIMQTPTTIQIRTAIEVLQKLGERINEHASRSLRQIPPSNVSGQLAAQISVNAKEQTKQVGEITGLLQTWRIQLEQQQRQTISHHV
jgi:hypothetical protein